MTQSCILTVNHPNRHTVHDTAVSFARLTRDFKTKAAMMVFVAAAGPSGLSGYIVVTNTLLSASNT